jgi:hypothetical protein
VSSSFPLLLSIVRTSDARPNIVPALCGAFPRRWRSEIFDVDNTLATAMIDRLMHHGEAIVIDGPSYRTGEGDEPQNP